MPSASINARKKLSALYARGLLVRFTPEGPVYGNPDKGGQISEDVSPSTKDDVEVWITAPNPLQKEIAMREGQAARARGLLKLKNDPNSEEYLTNKATLAEMSLDTLIDYIVIMESEGRANEAMREVLADKEWETFDELRDSMRQYEEAVAHFQETGEGEDPSEAEEWQSLLDAERRYAKQVGERELQLSSVARESLALVGRDDLEKRAMEKRGEIVGSTAFMTEYEAHMRYYSVRDASNHAQLFFDSVREYREASEIVQIAIGEALKSLISEGSEAKN